MSDTPVTSTSIVADTDAVDVPAPMPSKSFVAHAKLIGGLTLISRILGMARESVSAAYFGAGMVASAFTFAFAIPNLFRKLFGEGALSAAFIPLYSQALKDEQAHSPLFPSTERGERTDARQFAAASVNLLTLSLLAITLIGELLLFAVIWFFPAMRPDWLLAIKLPALMLPYVLLICSVAFLSSILQVHRHFGIPAAAPILLNVVNISAIVIGGRLLHLNARSNDASLNELLQTRLAFWLGAMVLAAGVGQIAMLWPSLRAVGFQWRWVRPLWTPPVKRMLALSVPVAIGAGVLQISVLMDKGLSLTLAKYDLAGVVVTHFNLLGHSIRFPMEIGANARLNWAQFLYQFPLGIFAIALATAIFPMLSADALDKDRTKFCNVMRQGIEASLFEGFAASAGLILVRYPCIRLLFQHGNVTSADTVLIARSVLFYSTAIWAFSLLQIVNRAYYALHDTRTPLVMSLVNISLNIVVEIPLIWTRLGEAGMAVGTSVSFAVQALVMLYLLDRRIGGMNLRQILPSIGKMIVAMCVMTIACLLVERVPGYPRGQSKLAAAMQLLIVMSVGGTTYCGTCALLGVEVLTQILPRRLRRRVVR